MLKPGSDEWCFSLEAAGAVASSAAVRAGAGRSALPQQARTSGPAYAKSTEENSLAEPQSRL
ncbi:hypothetical protein FOMG_19186 [Fusarium oxysporum f. sp. melonis 26406]|uniref:Uncharacterized protein n=1 Tax=Fusarium oxysporum f. sp. melonis 26406 TaxID=1089452 RepID=W9YX06_FUSOX|nr:hypothetical protein FOMG_19186 [Fusarium oxysporum f. sp. melonis 26406]